MELKMTSMIDVVFQLLIFFLLVSKFPDPEAKLKSWLPKNKGLHTTIPTVTFDDVRLVFRMRGKDELTCRYNDRRSADGFTYVPSVLDTSRYYTDGDENVPDWGFIRQLLQKRKAQFELTGEDLEGLPVVIDFTKEVKFKYIARVLDLCAEVEINNLQIAAPELEQLAKG